jgi:hypothetical protein
MGMFKKIESDGFANEKVESLNDSSSPHKPQHPGVVFAGRYKIPIRHLMFCFSKTRRLRHYGNSCLAAEVTN